MLIAGAVLSAIPGAQAIGVALLVGGALMVLSLINDAVAEANDGKGMLGLLASQFTDDEDIIKGFDIAFTVVLVAASIALAVATGGASTANVATGMKALADGLKLASAAIEIATAVGSAASNVGASSIRKDAAEIRSEASETQAESQDIQALMQQIDDLIDQSLEMLQQQGARFNSVIDGVVELFIENANTASSTQFKS